jgi:exosortase/archaeosortase family protein
MADFTIIILTLDEEVHLTRLLESIQGLHARICVMDSGSTDGTLNICRENNIDVCYRSFDNHPKQWDAALSSFKITSSWIIGLDADQTLSPELFSMLSNFKDEDHAGIDGIYFNRKNHYKGRWIKYGGYYPFYLLKMFRHEVGVSDLNENMDHRFIVPGKTIIWKKGHLLEENLKENNLQFWIEKHNRYSDLLADEECRMIGRSRIQSSQQRYWGSPNERKAWLKSLWWKLPRHLRPFIYFGYRMTVQLGFLDGRSGIIFHFLQGFWFRLIVDIKIEERQKAFTSPKSLNNLSLWNARPVKFLLLFPLLFFVLYGFNIAFIGVTTPGRLYLEAVDIHFNYIRYWREVMLTSTYTILDRLGYQVSVSTHQLRVHGHAGFNLVYSCLGYGVMSFFAAFVLAYPKSALSKWKLLIGGLITIQVLNVLRLLTISIYWKQTQSHVPSHHALFNMFLYSILLLMIYRWLNPAGPRQQPRGR